MNCSSTFVEITYEVTSQPSAQAGGFATAHDHAIGNPVSCEYERLQHAYAQTGHSTDEDNVSSIDPVIHQARSHGQSHGAAA